MSDDVVQLGFVGEKGPTVSVHGEDLIPSKFGGRPDYLDPNSGQACSLEQTLCSRCDRPMVLLAQLYSPLATPADAYHRALHLFCCRDPNCHPAHTPTMGFTVLRSQCAKNGLTAPGGDGAVQPPKCVVCGIAGPLRCGRCRSVNYCSKHHQAIHWRDHGHKKECSSATSSSSTSNAAAAATCSPPLFHQYAMDVEPEPGIEVEQAALERDRKRDDAMYKRFLRKQRETRRGRADDTDQEEQFDQLVQATVDSGGSNPEDPRRASAPDKVFDQFRTRCRRDPEQVLRYARFIGSKPLWMTTKNRLIDEDERNTAVDRNGAAEKTVNGNSDNNDDSDDNQDDEADPDELTPEPDVLPTDRAPDCQLCGAARRFEFQLMPQLLYFLGESDDPNQKTMDFGTVTVWTCEKSCSIESSTHPFVKEFCWTQRL